MLPLYIQQIIAIRKELKMTQSDLAKKMNIRQSNISRFEAGMNPNHTLLFLERIAKALGKNLIIEFRDKVE